MCKHQQEENLPLISTDTNYWLKQRPKAATKSWIQQDSLLLTQQAPWMLLRPGLFQGLQGIVPSIALVRHEPHSAKGSRAQRLAETEVAHRELFTSGGIWDLGTLRKEKTSWKTGTFTISQILQMILLHSWNILFLNTPLDTFVASIRWILKTETSTIFNT